MKKLFISGMVCVALAACDSNVSDNATVVHRCGEYDVDISIVDNDRISAVINGDVVELSRVISADGAKYDGSVNDTNVTLWSRGANWTLILGDDTVIECIAK